MVKVVNQALQAWLASLIDQHGHVGGLQFARELHPVDHTITTLVDVIEDEIDFFAGQPQIQCSEGVLEFQIGHLAGSYHQPHKYNLEYRNS